MKNTLKKSFYSIAGLSLIGLNSVNAMQFTGDHQINSGLVGKEDDAVNVIQNWISYITTFLYIVAVIIILWAGFNILTAAGDEEKIKKGKSIIIQAIAGILVIFIANSIVNWIINGLLASS